MNKKLVFNKRIKMDGIDMLNEIDSETVSIAFLDPQHREILNKLNYGNESTGKGKARSSLPQMSSDTIHTLITDINRVLKPSAHLFLWVDKFNLCTGIHKWVSETTQLKIVDMITWDKLRIGLGYRSRRKSEYLVVMQKLPTRAKGVWTIHNIPDVWQEKVIRGVHPHSKPISLQSELIKAVSCENDIVVDPAAGSFSVLQSCLDTGRRFIGCDING